MSELKTLGSGGHKSFAKNHKNRNYGAALSCFLLNKSYLTLPVRSDPPVPIPRNYEKCNKEHEMLYYVFPGFPGI